MPGLARYVTNEKQELLFHRLKKQSLLITRPTNHAVCTKILKDQKSDPETIVNRFQLNIYAPVKDPVLNAVKHLLRLFSDGLNGRINQV